MSENRKLKIAVVIVSFLLHAAQVFAPAASTHIDKPGPLPLRLM